MENVIHSMISTFKAGKCIALPSYCTGNQRVIESILGYYKEKTDYVLIEATSNQVNQFGGYTGLQPVDYKNMVLKIAKKVGINPSKIILGGDHLGPLVWCNEPEEIAMAKAVDLVRLYVVAGFQKIHLDTSMRLGNDSVEKPLSKITIARRGAVLFQACEKAFAELKISHPEAIHPVYIIGSEVPIPGGASGGEETQITVTDSQDLISTIETYKDEFNKLGINDAFDHIVGIVVQPGVEFDNDGVEEFVPENAKSLARTISKYNKIVYEGHSTDYQTPYKLREMVVSGVFILKVGPALTFAYREALTAMEKILSEISGYHGFSDALTMAMNKNDKNWRKHYDYNFKTLKMYQQYSYSDRCRYYLGDTRVQEAISELRSLFDKTAIPMFLVHQFLPLQYFRIRNKSLQLTFDSIIDDMVSLVLDNYRYATGVELEHNFFV